MWLLLGLCSALGLGFYDLCKKRALQDNAVLGVLFWATASGTACMLGAAFLWLLWPQTVASWGFAIQPLSWSRHGLVIAKSGLVAASWVCAYAAMKHLPISLVVPIRASAPVWTVIGALILFAEMLTAQQWLGLIIMLVSYFAFSMIGKREGVYFRSDPWIWLMILATLLGTCSSLYDKYLMHNQAMDAITLQFWFSVYLVPILLLPGLILAWLQKESLFSGFRWHLSVPAIGCLLIAADACYFQALRNQEAQIIILSALRRSSVVVSFAVGVWWFRDQQVVAKAYALVGVLIAVMLLLFAEG